PSPPRGRDDPATAVQAIVEDVRLRGDAALIEQTERLDGVRLTPDTIRVDPALIDKARGLVRPELLDALEVAAERLRSTCERQVADEWVDSSLGDGWVGELIRPLRRVGVYVPGGRAAYPSTVVMAAVPAQVAGVGSIAVVSPPGADGAVAEAVLAACSSVGIDEVYGVGGPQAIAALAYGTDTVRPVDKIVGPGNIYVTLAKRHVAGWVGVDADAGPSEIAIVADDSVPADILASDLIAQAEHGPLGTHTLITWLPSVAEHVMGALELEVARHERAEDVENALTEGGSAVLVKDLTHALETVNALAPEHLELCFEGASDVLDRVRNAGSVFVGPYSPVPIGDYVGGTNHVLPAGGAARHSSGLGVADFCKRIYVSSFERSALERLAPHVDALATAEGLFGHARAVRKRLEP
ncbi:MAG: histidinol dehydrogenase, partial [Actinomycetota bacterium]|nr:histidinol dehydrogenase [Actinomycetota bacterium]